LHASQGGKGANLAVGCWTVLSAQSDTRSGIPSTPVKALDTTGAGDCFVGALAAAMERGLEIEPAIRRVAASMALRWSAPHRAYRPKGQSI
jgi:sugar/nucleoside kinase (ribokinase family)